MGAHGRALRRDPRRGPRLIAYLHQAPAFGAVERYLEQLLQGLDEEAVVIAPRSSELEQLGAHAVLHPYEPGLGAASLLPRLVGELRRLRPRIVHVVDVWPLAFLAARIAHVPRLIVTHHTPELPRRDNAVGRLLWSLGWAMRPEVIYTSEADRRTDGRDGVVIPLGIDVDRFDVSRATPPGHVVGTVARLAEQKGIDTLVAAAPRVLERHPDATFVVVGEGEERDRLERAAAGLPFTFTGARDDVPDLLATFGVFAFPSRFEGLCLAVIEAQAAGVPVVATPVGGIVETVVPGQTGTLVPVDDPEALAEAIVETFDDRARAEAMAAEARRRARERFSIARMVGLTIALYG